MIAGCLLLSCQFVGKHDSKNLASNAGQNQIKDDLLRQMTRDVFYQDSIMRQIYAELDRIDAMYVVFERGLENNGRNQTRGQEIINRIKHLNHLLDNTRAELKKSSLENQGFLEMIGRFKRELEQKEIKIAELQNTVSEQESLIVQQTQTILKLEDINNEREKQVQALQKEMNSLKSAAYNDLADLLVRIAEEMPEVRGIFTRRTREEVELLQQKLILDAFRYFEEAAAIGNHYATARRNDLKTEYAYVK